MADGMFFKAAGPEEACDLLSQYAGSAHLLAGGTDLMPAVKKGELSPEVLIYIGDSGLDYIRAEGNDILIGAATPYTDIIRSELVRQKAPLLREVISQIGSPAIRNVGTMGGNLGTASPAACSAVGLLGLGATVRLMSKGGERTVAMEEFFVGPGESVLESGELIREIVVPVQTSESGWAYRKLGKRKAQILAIASVAIYCPRRDDKCRGVRIALGAVAPTPMLATKASTLLEGQRLDSELIDEVGRAAAEATNPIDDQRSTAWYRRRATEALVKQLLRQIALP